MAFKTQSDSNETMSDINVTPLVDVMLVLVIILLVTAPLLTQSVQVKLPKTTQTVADTKNQPLQLGIEADGNITLNKIPQIDLAMLERSLQTELSKDAEIGVHLYADQSVIYAKVAEIMATVQHSGIAKIAFVTTEK
jgi:biopolymer transport protein ExbD